MIHSKIATTSDKIEIFPFSLKGPDQVKKVDRTIQ